MVREFEADCDAKEVELQRKMELEDMRSKLEIELKREVKLEEVEALRHEEETPTKKHQSPSLKHHK
jgi:hypothetical protein